MEELTTTLSTILQQGMEALLWLWHFILGALEITGIVFLGLALYFLGWAIWRVAKATHRKLRG